MWFDWTPEKLKKLAQLWDDGLSASAIGKRLGTSKNSVINKVHRLNLPSRPSPITGDLLDESTVEQIREARRSGETRKSIAARFGIGERTVSTKTSDIIPAKRERVVVQRPRPQPAPVKLSVPKKILPKREVGLEAEVLPAYRGTLSATRTCQWVTSDDTGRGRIAEMCGKPALIRSGGTVWCWEHLKIVSPREARAREAQADELV